MPALKASTVPIDRAATAPGSGRARSNRRCRPTPSPTSPIPSPIRLSILTLLIVLATVGGVTRLRVDVRLALLALGLGITLLTDLAYLRLDPAGYSDHGDPVDLGWLLALVPLAAAASLGDNTPRPHRVAVESTEHAATTPPTG